MSSEALFFFFQLLGRILCASKTRPHLFITRFLSKKKEKEEHPPLPLRHGLLSALLPGSDVRALAFGRPPLLPLHRAPAPLPLPHAHALCPCPLCGPPPFSPRVEEGALLGVRKELSGLPRHARLRGRRKRRAAAEGRTPRKRQSTRPKAPTAHEKRQMKKFKEANTQDTPQTAQEQETLSFPGGRRPQRSATDDRHEAKPPQPRNTSTNGLSF